MYPLSLLLLFKLKSNRQRRVLVFFFPFSLLFLLSALIQGLLLFASSPCMGLYIQGITASIFRQDLSANLSLYLLVNICLCVLLIKRRYYNPKWSLLLSSAMYHYHV